MPSSHALGYNNFGTFLKKRFSAKVYKISIDCGLSCPNIDGTKGKNGCIYCDNSSFVPNTSKSFLNVKSQLDINTKRMAQRYAAEKFIAYFQNYTNTYESDDKLISLYNDAINYNDVIGLSVATRPDFVSDGILNYLNNAGSKKYVTLEYGLQSSHDKTLKIINRGHDFNCFRKTFARTRKYSNINICVHIIFGLPGETKEMMLDTVKTLAGLKIDGIKFHHLHAVKGTKLERMYLAGEVDFLSLEEYIDIVISSLEILPQDVIIHRLFGLSDEKSLIAPKYGLSKSEFTTRFQNELKIRNTYQGRLYDF
jgi:radical SAM protein (TIGR01212 family)